jgi:hypothetical protein
VIIEFDVLGPERKRNPWVSTVAAPYGSVLLAEAFKVSVEAKIDATRRSKPSRFAIFIQQLSFLK